MVKDNTFEGLYREELKDLYDAERQIVEALPDMIQAASSEELKAAFQTHLEQTQEHVRRLKHIFDTIDGQPGNELCEGMRGLLSEGRMAMNEYNPSPVLDAALIAAAQKVEHYEISGYSAAIMLAEMLDHDEAARLLQSTLEEEEETDDTLSQIAESLLMGEELEEEEVADEEVTS